MNRQDTREPFLELVLAECVFGIRTLYADTGSVPDCLIGPFTSAMGALVWSYASEADLWILKRAGELDDQAQLGGDELYDHSGYDSPRRQIRLGPNVTLAEDGA